MTDPLLEKHRSDILRLAARHGASNVRVFGSRARGEGREDSDLDLLVTMKKGTSLLTTVALKRELETLVRRHVDIVTEAALSPYIRDRVLAEALPL